MAKNLYGRPVDQAINRLGALSQAVAIEASTRTNGPDAGSRRIRIVNGLLDLEILPDRGLDLGQLRVAGVPLAWVSPTGFPGLSGGDSDGLGWLRGFGGGILTTCGLLNFGPSVVDDGQTHPMHGRYSSLSANVTRAEATNEEIIVEGVVSEASVLGMHLELRRRIRMEVGSLEITVDDTVTNRSGSSIAPMVLYHLNLGWPLVAEGTELVSPALDVQARDAVAERGLSTWSTFPELSDEYPEHVFRHELPVDRDVDVAVRARSGLGMRIGFHTHALPGLFQWRVAGAGHNVLGIEPATAPTIHGRADARERGMLAPLAPGEQRCLGVRLAVEIPGGV